MLTGELELEFIEDIDKRLEAKTVGYASYIEFNNGFRNTLFMTEAQMKNHAKRYSQSYQYDVNYNKKNSNWSKNFEAMALKTVLKLNISKYGALSVEIQKALQTDGMVVNEIEDDGTIAGKFSDNNGDVVEVIDDIKATDEDRVQLLKLAEPLKINLVDVVKKELRIDFETMSKSEAEEVDAFITDRLADMM